MANRSIITESSALRYQSISDVVGWFSQEKTQIQTLLVTLGCIPLGIDIFDLSDKLVKTDKDFINHAYAFNVIYSALQCNLVSDDENTITITKKGCEMLCWLVKPYNSNGSISTRSSDIKTFDC